MAVDDVTVAVPQRQLVGLVGPNGAGKSTLFGVLSGLIRPSQGTVLLDGDDVTNASPQVRAERGLARTFQHPEIFGGLTVRQHLVLAHRTRTAKRRIWSDLFTLGSLRPVDPVEKALVDELIDSLGLGPVANRLAVGLPLGVSRRVELGRALATSPTVLLLDEPSSGLDSTETDEFESTLRRIANDHGVSVLIVEQTSSWSCGSVTRSTFWTSGSSSPEAPPTRSAGTDGCKPHTWARKWTRQAPTTGPNRQ